MGVGGVFLCPPELATVRNPTAPRRLGRRRGGNAGTGNSYAPGDCPRGRRASDAGMLTTAVPTRALIALSEACCIPSYDRRQAPRLRGHRGNPAGNPACPQGTGQAGAGVRVAALWLGAFRPLAARL